MRQTPDTVRFTPATGGRGVVSAVHLPLLTLLLPTGSLLLPLSIPMTG